MVEFEESEWDKVQGELEKMLLFWKAAEICITEQLVQIGHSFVSICVSWRPKNFRSLSQKRFFKNPSYPTVLYPEISQRRGQFQGMIDLESTYNYLYLFIDHVGHNWAQLRSANE